MKIKRILTLALAAAVGYRMGQKKRWVRFGTSTHRKKAMNRKTLSILNTTSELTEGKVRRGGVKPRPKNQRPDVKPIPQKPRK